MKKSNSFNTMKYSIIQYKTIFYDSIKYNEKQEVQSNETFRIIYNAAENKCCKINELFRV